MENAAEDPAAGLRHRVTGLIDAAEGRATHLVEQAEREALDLRRGAVEDALAAVEAMERQLADLRRRLTAAAAAIDTPAERTQVQPSPRFARASMRDRPIAALFEVTARAG